MIMKLTTWHNKISNMFSCSHYHVVLCCDGLICVSLSPSGWPLDPGLLYSIESLTVQWSLQIWDVLKKDSGALLQRGDHPGPAVEIQFWSAQRANLLGIQSQVR